MCWQNLKMWYRYNLKTDNLNQKFIQINCNAPVNVSYLDILVGEFMQLLASKGLRVEGELTITPCGDLKLK